MWNVMDQASCKSLNFVSDSNIEWVTSIRSRKYHDSMTDCCMKIFVYAFWKTQALPCGCAAISWWLKAWLAKNSYNLGQPCTCCVHLYCSSRGLWHVPISSLILKVIAVGFWVSLIVTYSSLVGFALLRLNCPVAQWISCTPDIASTSHQHRNR